jgi:acyl-CoA synthetase (AMP-forming)/AMP-acid ligase II
LFVRGPNVMKRYLNPEADAQFQALDGWYDTGDLAHVDADGFLTLLGRLKRFAKISGEMVSLTAVEDALAGAFPHYGSRCEIAVISRPDADKGEQLIAMTNEPRLELKEVRQAVQASGLSNLCVPRQIVWVSRNPQARHRQSQSPRPGRRVQPSSRNAAGPGTDRNRLAPQKACCHRHPRATPAIPRSTPAPPQTRFGLTRSGGWELGGSRVRLSLTVAV